MLSHVALIRAAGFTIDGRGPRSEESKGSQAIERSRPGRIVLRPCSTRITATLSKLYLPRGHVHLSTGEAPIFVLPLIGRHKICGINLTRCRAMSIGAPLSRESDDITTG